MLVRRELPERPVFPALRTLFNWDPFREMMPVFGTEPEMEARFVPMFEVKETPASFVFYADLPGIEEKHLDITLTANRLTVSGKREEEREEKGEIFYLHERSYGTFTRTFTLPDGIDGEHVTAELKAGVLTIVVPKEPEHQPRKVSVKGVVEGVVEKVKGALEKGAKA